MSRYSSPYGKREGLAERLRAWERKLATDRQYPWQGTGICDDLRAAADALEGKSNEAAETEIDVSIF